jgi:hypothetical protein
MHNTIQGPKLYHRGPTTPQLQITHYGYLGDLTAYDVCFQK